MANSRKARELRHTHYQCSIARLICAVNMQSGGTARGTNEE